MGRFASFATKAAKVGAAGVVVGTVASVKAFHDFDKAMTESLAIMGDVSDKQRKDMVGAAREVGRTTSFSATQAGEAYFFLASAGLSAKQSMAALPQVAAFAQAGNFDLATATSLAADAQSALGLRSKNAGKNLKELTRVTDVLVQGNIQANAEVDQLSEALTTKAGAAAKNLGKDIEETVAVLSAFADQGVKGEIAGTALNIVWRDLQTAALKNKEAFKEQNIAVFDSQGEFRNTAAVVGDLERSLAGMSDEEKKATLTKLGFQDRSQAFIITLLGTSAKIREYERELRKASGTTKTVAAKQLEGLAGSFTLLKSQVEDGALALGGALAPALKSAADSLRVFFEGIRTGTGAGGQFRQAVEGIGGVLIPIGTVLGQITLKLGEFGLGLATTKAGVVIMSAAVGGLVGRMIALGAIWAVGKVVAFASAVGNAVTMVRTAISVTTSLRGAVMLLTGSTLALRGAMLTTGIGALVVGIGTAIAVYLSLSSETEKAIPIQKRLQNVMQGLKSSSDRLRNTRRNDKQASHKLKVAEENLNAVIQKHGPHSRQALEAERRYRQEKMRSANASRELKEAEQVHGRELQLLKRILPGLVRQQAINIVKLERQRDAWLDVGTGANASKKEQEAAYRKIQALDKRIDQSKQSLNNTYLRAAREVNPKYSRSIEAIGDSIAKANTPFGRLNAATRSLTKSLSKLPRKKNVEVDVKINIPGVSFGGGGGGGAGSGWPLSEHIDASVTKRVRDAAVRDPLGALGAATGIGGLSGGAPGHVSGFNPLAAQFGLGETSGYRPGDDGYHGINRARDYADGAPRMLAFAKLMAAVFGSRLRELIHSPLGFSVKDFRKVPPFAVADHYDHVHVAMQQGGVVPGVGSGDKVPVGIMAEPSESIFVLNRNATAVASALGSLNAAFPRFQRGGKGKVNWGRLVGASWDNDELATLAHVVGMPNPGLMAQIAQGESSGNARAVGHDPGGTEGLGLWQITTGYNDALIARLGGRTAMFNPLKNAQAAKAILESSGLGAWYAPPTGPRGEVDPNLARAIRGGDGDAGSAGGRGRRARPGRTRRGGGTEGPAGRKRKGERDPRQTISLPGLGPGTVPKVLQGLGPGITSLFTGPGMTREQRFEASDLALQRAEATKDPGDDRAVLQFQLGAAKQRKQAIQREINRLNKRLGERLTKKQRQQILAKRNALLAELGDVQGRIGSAQKGLAGEAGEGEEGGETEAQRQQREALEANTAAIEAQAAQMKELKEEMKRQTDFATAATASSSATAWRALADILSGNLGARTNQMALAAGPGSIGGL